jgi:hypothetical protein
MDLQGTRLDATRSPDVGLLASSCGAAMPKEFDKYRNIVSKKMDRVNFRAHALR